jgi:hypothetical protein
MRISSIDPGWNTGVAIAVVHDSISTLTVTLEKYLLCTLVDEPKAVAELVLASRSKICVMEQKPRNAADSKTVPNTLLKSLLGDLTVLEIAPGIWKPVMRSRLAELELWSPETQHEKDAMAMLYYFCLIKYPGRKVLYV